MLCKKPFLNFPCGRCIPCTTTKRKEWTHRLILEGLNHEEKCFITLTYNDKSLPQGGTLVKRDAQLFIKRLRQNTKKTIRYYLVGEYGGESERPHYHAVLFGMHCSNFSPEIPIDGRWRCECDTCNSIRFAWNQRTESIKQKDAKQWNKGKTDVAEFNRLTAQYVAGYVTKKINSQQIGDREKEFSFMSKNPGIGALAVEDIGNHLNHRVNKLKEWDGDVPSYLKHGGKIMPLGKYMKNKLRAYLKVGERTVLEKKGVSQSRSFEAVSL